MISRVLWWSAVSFVLGTKSGTGLSQLKKMRYKLSSRFASSLSRGGRPPTPGQAELVTYPSVYWLVAVGSNVCNNSDLLLIKYFFEGIQ